MANSRISLTTGEGISLPDWHMYTERYLASDSPRQRSSTTFLDKSMFDLLVTFPFASFLRKSSPQKGLCGDTDLQGQCSPQSGTPKGDVSLAGAIVPS
jgi:hypothetical protein